MRESKLRLPSDIETKHLGTPTAGVGTGELLELVRLRRVQAPDGHWGWAKVAKSSAALAGAVRDVRGAARRPKAPAHRRSGSPGGERRLR